MVSGGAGVTGWGFQKQGEGHRVGVTELRPQGEESELDGSHMMGYPSLETTVGGGRRMKAKDRRVWGKGGLKAYWSGGPELQGEKKGQEKQGG